MNVDLDIDTTPLLDLGKNVPSEEPELYSNEVLEQKGFSDAGYFNGDPRFIGTSARPILLTFVNSISENSQEAETKKEQLESEIKSLNDDLRNEEAYAKSLKEKNNQLNEASIPEKIEKVESKEWTKTDNNKVLFGRIILVFLTIFLIIFYSSLIYTTFFESLASRLENYETDELSQSLGAVFNPKALRDAINTGFIGMLFIICAPILFLAAGFASIGYLNRTSNKEDGNKSSNKNRNTLVAVIILACVLLIDILMAYKLSRGIYESKILMGLENNSWNAIQVLKDINFYIVILTGFGGYVLWGIVVQIIFQAYEKYEPEIPVVNQIQNYENQVEELIESSIYRQNSIQSDIRKKEVELIRLKKWGILDRQKIEAYLSNYEKGWMQYLYRIAGVQGNDGKGKLVLETRNAFKTMIDSLED